MFPRILMIYPKMPTTYWSFRYALPFIGKKASLPPLGLITVAAMLPKEYPVKLIDMNVSPLNDRDIAKADLVFISAMIAQKPSMEDVIRRCQAMNKPVVAGGPYPTSSHRTIAGVRHFVLNEAEVTLPRFLDDYTAGKAGPLYEDETKPDITHTPPPRYDLLDIRKYAGMALQYSRGCPFNCEFCDIVEMFGRIPRTKTAGQFLNEMQALYTTGFRGSLFIVDDNFIGNKKNVRHLLPRVAQWQKDRRYPFELFTEASINLAEDDELMDMMIRAGFNMVFIGIETPVKESLLLTHKTQNTKMDMLDSIRIIQKKGMEVTGGFIIGFDNDPEDIFDRQIALIQKSGIPQAMVGLLTALPKTRLFRRLKSENRLLEAASCTNNDLQINFQPKMEMQKLLDGYKSVINQIYNPDTYFRRCLTLLKNLKPQNNFNKKINYNGLKALVLSMSRQTFTAYGWAYWKFMIRGFFTKPRLFSEVVTMAVKGHHFFKITRSTLAVDRFRSNLADKSKTFRERINQLSLGDVNKKIQEIINYRDILLSDIRRQYRRLNKDFRPYVEESLNAFLHNLDETLYEITVGSYNQSR